MIASFTPQLSSFMRFLLRFVALNTCAVNVLFGKSFPMPMSSVVLPNFSLIRFRVSHLMLKSTDHCKLSFVQDHNMDLFAFLYMQTSSLSSYKDVFFSSVYFYFSSVISLSKVKVSISLWTYVGVHNLIPLINIYVLCQYYDIFSTLTLQYNLKSEKLIIPEVLVFIIIQDCFGHPVVCLPLCLCVCFHIQLKIVFF